MARLRVLSTQGDQAVSWSASRAQAGDPEALAAVREAERIFAAARAAGATAFRVTGTATEIVTEFDPQAEEILVVPRLAGG